MNDINNNIIKIDRTAIINIEFPKNGGYSYEIKNIEGLNISRIIYALEAIKFDLLKSEGEK